MKKNSIKIITLVLTIGLCSISSVVSKQELSDVDTEFSDGDFTFLIDTKLFFNDDTHTLMVVNATGDTVCIFDDVYMNDKAILNADLSSYAGDNINWDAVNLEFDSTGGGLSAYITNWTRSGTTIFTKTDNDDLQVNGTVTGDSFYVSAGEYITGGFDDVEIHSDDDIDLYCSDVINSDGSIIPFLNMNYDLGSAGLYWDKIFGTNLTFYNGLYINSIIGGGDFSMEFFTNHNKVLDLELNGSMVFTGDIFGNGNGLTFSWLNTTYSKLGHSHDYTPSSYANATFAKMTWANATFAPIGSSGAYVTNITRSGTTLYSMVDGDDLVINGTVTGSNLNIADWDTAFGWGDHAGIYSLLAHAHDYTPSDYANATFAKMLWVNNTFMNISVNPQQDDLSDNTSTQLSDTADLLYEAELDSEAELEGQIADVTNFWNDNDFADNSANWDTAFGWGDHAGIYSLLAHAHDYTPSGYANATFAKMTWSNGTFAPISVTGGYTTNWTRNNEDGGKIFTTVDGDKVVINNTISTTSNISTKDIHNLYGELCINSSDYIKFKSNNDLDNYIRFRTLNNVPRLETNPSTDLMISPNGDLVLSPTSTEIDADDCYISNLNGLTGTGIANFYITCPTAVDIGTNGDNDDLLRFSTVSNVPEIITIGDCDLKLNPSGNVINNSGNISIMNDDNYHTWIKSGVEHLTSNGWDFDIPVFTGKSWISTFGIALADTMGFKGGVYAFSTGGNTGGRVLCAGDKINGAGDNPTLDINYVNLYHGSSFTTSLGDEVHELTDGEQYNFSDGAIVNNENGLAQYVVGTSQTHTLTAELAHEFTVETTEDNTFFTHSTASSQDEITVLRDGWYKISYNINWDNDVADRISVRAYVEDDGTEISPSDSHCYIRHNTYGRYGTNSATFICEITGGSVLEVHSEIINGAGNYGETGDVDTIADECWLLIERL